MSILKTIYLQHLNGANANMTLDSSGRVGIGNTSPSYPLHVGGEIFSGRSDSSAEGGQISLGRASDNALHYYIDCYGGSTTPSMRFVDGSAGAVRMNIDSNGNVTKPYQPMFRASNTSGNITTTAGQEILFNSVGSNIGSGYNTATGRFTCPVSGYYLFALSIFDNTNANVAERRYSFAINGGGLGQWTKFDPPVQGGYGSSTLIYYLNAGDYVSVTVAYTGGVFYGGHSFFMGYLLG